MTVSTTGLKDQYWGDGVTAAFNVTNQFQNAAELLVVILDVDGVTEIPRTLITHYNVTGGAGGIGQVIFTPGNIPTGTGSPGSQKVTIARNMPLTQATDLTPNDPFPADTVERSLGDRLIMIVQQQQEKIARSVQLQISSALTSAPALLDPVANTALVYDATGTKIIPGPTITQIANAQTYATAAAASASAALVSQNAAAASAVAINFRFCGTATGSANALTLTPGAPLTSYTGALLEFIIASANTTEAMTVNASTLGNKSLKINPDGTKTDPAIGMFQPGMHVIGQYDGTDVVVLNMPWDNQATDIAAAATVALASATGNFANLTGTGGPVTAITGLVKGKRMLLRHTGIQTLTNSGTLVLLSGANITTAAGDFSEWVSDGTNVYMSRYMRASGLPLVAPTVAPTSGYANKFINGSLEIWQRGTSFTPGPGAVTYTADRWHVFRAGASAYTVTRVTGLTNDAQYAIKVQRTPGDTGVATIIFGQLLEVFDAVDCAGKTVTISVDVKCGANFSAALSKMDWACQTGTVPDEGSVAMVSGFTGNAFQFGTSPVLTTGVQRLSFQAAIPAGTKELATRFTWLPSGTAGADDSITFGNIDMRIDGGITHEVRPIPLELIMCQRFYEKTFPQSVAPAQNAGQPGSMNCSQTVGASASMTATGISTMKVTKRVAPAITTYNPLAANAQARNLSTSVDCTGTVTGGIGDSGFALGLTTPAGSAAGQQLAVHLTFDSEL